MANAKYITLEPLASKTKTNLLDCYNILDELTRFGVVEKLIGVRCPNCGLLLETFKEKPKKRPSCYCARCDEVVTVRDAEYLYRANTSDKRSN